MAPAWRAACGLGGLLAIWVAVGSPLATLHHEWLTVHMVQHLLLMSVAAPLIWLAAPPAPMMRVVPPRVALFGRSVLRRPAIRHAGGAIAHPVTCWLAAAVTLTIWHVPAVLTLAMHSNTWHLVQQASFLVAGLLFWWPVVQPWAGSRAEPHVWMVLYLFLATLPCDVLSAFLIFSEQVAYPIYLVTSERSVASVLEDQARAGALMWTSVTIVYLSAAATLVLRGVRS